MARQPGDIEAARRGTWSEQAISKLNPGSGVNFVISGPVSSTLVDTVDPDESIIDLRDDVGDLYLVGLGLRKDSGYRETLLNCREIWVPFKDESDEIHRVVLKVGSRSSYPNWIYVWASDRNPEARIDRTWLPVSYSGIDIYNLYASGEEDLDYSIITEGPGGILFIPYVHPTYLTTDDYNAVLGNVMQTAEPVGLYSIFNKDVEDPLKYLSNPNLRYKNYIEDCHKTNAVGATHAGEINITTGDLSRCEEQSEYFRSFQARGKELDTEGSSGMLQTLDLPYMSYRAVSASVYVDQYNATYVNGSPVAVDIEKVWKDLQGGNTDDPETVYFVNKASITSSEQPVQANYIKLEERTSIPVTGSILFRMDGHTAVRVSKATVYVPFLNTVYRTGQYGEVLESFTSESNDSN